MAIKEILYEKKNLLPEGLSDFLFPMAERRLFVKNQLCNNINLFGYNLIEPPLVEFEKTLMSGLGKVNQKKIFKFIDPQSQEVLGIRADITPQVGRIVSTRLSTYNRPLRIMYRGDVLIIKGNQIKPERQFSQVGYELISNPSIISDTEILLIAIDSLSEVGINNISIDISMPTLLFDIFSNFKLQGSDLVLVKDILFHRDIDRIKSFNKELSTLLTSLINYSGPIDHAKHILGLKIFSEQNINKIKYIFDFSNIIRDIFSKVNITVDFVENADFDYHTGITFRIYSSITSKELGRGGRYQISHEENKKEDATGFTFFTDYLVDEVNYPSEKPLVYLSRNNNLEIIRSLKDRGYRLVFSLSDEAPSNAEAKKLGCTHFFHNSEIKECF